MPNTKKQFHDELMKSKVFFSWFLWEDNVSADGADPLILIVLKTLLLYAAWNLGDHDAKNLDAVCLVYTTWDNFHWWQIEILSIRDMNKFTYFSIYFEFIGWNLFKNILELIAQNKRHLSGCICSPLITTNSGFVHKHFCLESVITLEVFQTVVGASILFHFNFLNKE